MPRAGVTSGFFSVLGVQPALGRAFVPEDDKGWPQTVAIISHGLWKRRFGSDPAIVGKQVLMSSMPLTIIGVMPAGFEYPEQTQIWVPTAVNLRDEPRDNRVWSAIARLNSRVDLKQAQTRLSAISAQLEKQFHETNNGWDVTLSTLHERLVRELKPSLLALLGAVGFVLLIACANVANLLLARSAARQKEIAIRAAMGASRARVLRQMLTESVLLSVIGGAAGVVLSIWLTDVLMSMLPEGAPRIDQIGIDYRVLTFAFGVSAVTGILFGIVPALQASKLDVTSALKEGGRSGEGHRRTSARSLLLIGEVALSLMLLVGAGLLIKSFLRLQEVRPGFNAHHVLTARLSLQGPQYKKEQQYVEFFRQFKELLAAEPGVQAVGGSVNLPLNQTGYAIGRAFIPEGRPRTVEEARDAMFSTITGDYFRALEIPLLAGRLFEPRDDAEGPILDSAQAESLAAIGAALAENGKVIVTGCMGAEPRRSQLPGRARRHWAAAIRERGRSGASRVVPPRHDPFLDLVPPEGIKLTPRHYAYLKISEGCNNRCTFCIIPPLRGDLVSRPAGDVLREAERLVAAGVKEILVISQDTSAYGIDVKYAPGEWKTARCRPSSSISPTRSANSASGCACTTSIPIRMSTTSFR